MMMVTMIVQLLAFCLTLFSWELFFRLELKPPILHEMQTDRILGIKSKQTDAAVAIIDILKNPLGNVVRWLAEWSET